MKTNNIKYHDLRVGLIAGLCAVFSISTGVYAQEVPTDRAPGDETPIDTPSETPNDAPGASDGFTGISQLQAETESAVRATCSGFVRNPNEERNALQQDLFDACRSMVHSRNALTGVGATRDTRGLTEEQLASSFQNIAAEENFAPTRIATNAASGQISTIAARLTKLRTGNVGLVAKKGDYSYRYAALEQYAGTGGAAGDDDTLLSHRFGGFINGTGGFGEIDPTDREDAADFEHKGVTAGIDYRVLDNLVFGVAGSYSVMDLDFDNTSNVSGGSVESDTYGVLVYGTYYLDGFYVDGMFGYSWSDYDIDRRMFIGTNTAIDQVDRIATASPDGEQREFSVQTGYNFDTGGFSFGPYAKFTHVRVEIDSYDEEGAGGLNLRMNEQNVESLQSVVGGQASYAFSQPFGIIMPYFRFEWNHEFRDNSRILNAQYVNDPRNTTLIVRTNSPDRDYFGLNAGISTVLEQGFQAFINYKTVLDHAYIESHVFTLGLKMEF